MNLKQTVYFMSLVGGIAGLLCWGLQVFLSDIMSFSQSWVVSAVYATLLGALLGGLTVAFADKWGSDRMVPSWVLIGTMLGALAGFLSGFLSKFITEKLIQPSGEGGTGFFGVLLVWLIAGGLIGLAIGFRWASVNPLRAVHAFVGGVVGGGLGGALIAAQLGSQEWIQALAFILLGAGITLGVTLAPMLLSDGVLQFVSSGDPRAQNKYGSPRQEWVVQDGDQLVIGSQGAGMSMTMYGQEVQIYVPDAMVSPKHAVLFAKNRRFYIQLHPENVGPQGQPLEPLQLGDENISGTRELRNGDEIVVGQTLLRFLTKKKQVGPEIAHAAPAMPSRRVR